MTLPTLRRREPAPAHARPASGQALVIMVMALVVLMGISGLVIDGGNAMANTRGVQNGADAAAEAGALVLASRLAGSATPAGGWDASVQAAILASAAANGVTVEAAYYTDICGIPLKSDGTASLTGGGSYDFSNAKAVGTGMPNPTSTTPDCPSYQVGPATGVLVKTRRDVPTYFARVLGIATMPVGALTTAAAGFLQESCAASDSEWCGLLPIAMPVNQVSCDGSNNVVDTGNQWSSDGKTVYKIPLCKNGPGNVGWLDWSPKGGGTSELINEVGNPTNGAVPLPSWQFISSTGNPNSSGLESAIRAYDGQIVLVPQFDLTCNPGSHSDPDNTAPAINTGPQLRLPGRRPGWQRLQPVVPDPVVRPLPAVRAERSRTARRPARRSARTSAAATRRSATRATARRRASSASSRASSGPGRSAPASAAGPATARPSGSRSSSSGRSSAEGPALRQPARQRIPVS